MLNSFVNLLCLTIKIVHSCGETLLPTQIMRAVQVRKPGNIEDMYIDNSVDKPTLRELDVLIRVHAAAINRADTLQRRGLYPPPAGASDIMGLEAVGVVDALGPGVTKWKVGDKVMTLLTGGGYAEFVGNHENLLMPIPQSLSFNDAAAMPEVWLTAFQLLHFVGNMKDGETVLIHAGGSGVGTAAVQLARHTVANSRILVTAGHQDKINLAKKLGADDGFNYKEGNFAEKVLSATNGQGVDLLLDCVGASFWQQNADSMKMDGRWVLYGSLGGVKTDGDLMGRIMRKRLTISGTTLRTRSVEYKSRLIDAFSLTALPLFESGKLVPVVHAVFPLDKIQDAHRTMEMAENAGKIVLEVLKEDGTPKSDL